MNRMPWVLGTGMIAALLMISGCPPDSIIVPNVVGQTQASASLAIVGAGLTVGVVTEAFSASVSAGQVISQSPAAGASVDKGAVVALTISKGPQQVNINIEMLPVAGGIFTMGSSGAGDDAAQNHVDESPAHSVTLSAYQIGKYEVTNRQYCDVLNWALAQGYLKTLWGEPWAGTGNIYAGGDMQLLVDFVEGYCDIQFSGGVFFPKTRETLFGKANLSMDTHPMVDVSWYGAVAFCNWLSQIQGLTPCYDMTVANWPLTTAPPTPGGYRLPTEAEWERAAAWDGAKHWIYGLVSDTLTGNNRCNYNQKTPYVNPLGLSTEPYTSPVGWFNGANISPNGNVTTVNSPSPVGAYDMSGNVWEWCGDWYNYLYYQGGNMTNPTGPTTGSIRVIRGGGWWHDVSFCRTAGRFSVYEPSHTHYSLGFRVVR